MARSEASSTIHNLVHELVFDPPRLHSDRSGNLIGYRITQRLLEFLDGRAGPESRTLETGAGITTVLFAAKGSQHVAIAPDPGLEMRIRDYCASKQIDTGRMEFIAARSEEILPRLPTSDLDLVLIDGRHAFPSPAMDWFYTSHALKVGGTLVLDDVHLWAGRMLHRFLRRDRDWIQLHNFYGMTSVFQKVGDTTHRREWQEQPFGPSMLGRWFVPTRLGLGLMWEGRFAELRRRISRSKPR